MKNSLFILLPALILSFLDAQSQDIQDYIILDEGAEEMFQLNSSMLEQSNIYRIDGFSPDAMEQISDALKGMQIRDLQIFVLTKPGSLVFNNLSVTSENMEEWSSGITEWKNSIQSKVVIHSDVVFSGDEGMRLKQNLESVSGLEFTMRNLK
jgi:hypothetical protein